MPRIQSLDLARGFTVLFFAPVHAVLLFSKPYVYHTPFGLFLTFIAEDIGAQVFMLLMGISFIFSRHNNFKSVFKKVLLLFAAGYVLNFLKFVLPAMSGLLPDGVYTELQVGHDVQGLLQMLLTGDILQFAALALMIMYFVTRLPHYTVWVLVLITIICLLSPFCYDLHTNNFWSNKVLEVLGGQTPRVFFPLLPWLVYPLVGMIIGYYIKQQKPLVFGYCMIVGFVLMIVACSSWMPYHDQLNASFYRTYTSGTFYHLGIVLIWMYLIHWFVKHHPHRLLLKPLIFLSKHITLIYCLQWILVCWSLPFIGFRTLGTWASIAVSLSIGILTIFLTMLFLLLKQKHKIFLSTIF